MDRQLDSHIRMPVLFVGHGSPMNAIEDNEFSKAWIEEAKTLPKPEAIICISAHWQTIGTLVTAMERPRTIHDFYGFPQLLFLKQYPAKGLPELAGSIQKRVSKTRVRLDLGWGLDHGTWSVLCRMFPNADIPVIQISLDSTKDPRFHYELAKELMELRDKGILIMGSGNIVHNLSLVEWQDSAFEWALQFDEKIKELILARDHNPIINYNTLGEMARLSVPTNEHYLPLIYILAMQDTEEEIRFFAEKVTLGSISMRSLRIGC